MEYLFILLIAFIGILLLMQMILFEVTKRRMDRSDNINWYLSLDKPFNYNRTGSMAFICLICYIISSPEDMFSASWFIYFFLFLALGIISDAIVQYLIMIYSKKRCRKQIDEAQQLKAELEKFIESPMVDDSYEQTASSYDETQLLRQYLVPQDHLAIMSVDGGQYGYEFEPKPEATFIVDPHAKLKEYQDKYKNDKVKMTTLTSSGQMPFKDEKIDIVLCENSNYDKKEVYRVLKKNGYFIVNQNGTTNLKEFVQMYMPFKINGTWDAYSCAQTLEGIGMRIIDRFEDYGTIRFHSIQAIHTYFQRVSPDLSNIQKYQIFYLKALKAIHENHYFEMTTHKFLVIAQK